jgi:putative oxidoreductase
MTFEKTRAEWTPRMLSILRIVAALLFMAHGTQKLLGFPASEFAPSPFSLMWFAGVLELIGGAALVLGILARPVAFVLSGQMAVAYWMAHAPQSPFPVVNGGDASVLFCFVFLYLVFAGPGPWSVDTALGREPAGSGEAAGAR